jgi:hypothetical protein
MLANSVLHFNLSIFLPPHTKTVKQLTLNVNTYYKHYELPIKYELTNASINFLDKKLDLGESFPGKIASKEIRVRRFNAIYILFLFRYTARLMKISECSVFQYIIKIHAFSSD